MFRINNPVGSSGAPAQSLCTPSQTGSCGISEEPDLIIVLGADCQLNSDTKHAIDEAEQKGLKVLIVDNGKLPDSIPDHAMIYVSTHGKTSNSQRGNHHVITLKNGDIETALFIKQLRTTYPNWKAIIHLSSCFVGHVRKELDRQKMGELGPCILYSSATRPLGTFHSGLRALCHDLAYYKSRGERPTDLDIYATVQSAHEDCISAFGEFVDGELINHSPKTIRSASPPGLRQDIETALSRLDGGKTDPSGAPLKPQVIGTPEVLRRLRDASRRLEERRSPDWRPVHRLQGGLNARVIAGKRSQIEQWFKDDPLAKGRCLPLHKAVKLAAPRSTIEKLAASGVNIDEPDEGGMAALHHACLSKRGQLEAVKALVTCGANVRATIATLGSTPLHCAVHAGQLDIARLLVDAGADPDATDKHGSTALHVAACNGRSDIAQVLIRAKANPNLADENGYTPLHEAVNKGDLAVTSLLLENGANPNTIDKDGSPVLSHAAASSDEQAHLIVSKIIEYGGNVNATSKHRQYPIHMAACYNNISLLAVFIDKKVNIKVVDDDGSNVLHFAINGKNASSEKISKTIEILLESGADINAPSFKGQTPLLWAISVKRPDLVEFILSKQANVDLADNKGVTPLHEAVRKNYPDAVELLLKHGADTERVDRRKRRAIDYAQNDVIVQLFEKYQKPPVDRIGAPARNGRRPQRLVRRHAERMLPRIRSLRERLPQGEGHAHVGKRL